MRRFILTSLTIGLSLLPAAAFATAATPSELFQALTNDTRAKSFSINAHSASNGTYVAVWAKGVQQGGETVNSVSLAMDATVDVKVDSNFTRVKGSVIVVDGSAYLRITNAQGKSLPQELLSFVKAKKWIRIPLTTSEIDPTASLLSTAGADLSSTDTMFTMDSSTSKNVVTYEFRMSPTFASSLAKQLRDLLGDTQPISTDFFPFEALARSITFSMTVKATPTDVFLSSVVSFQMKTPGALFIVKGTESALGKPLSLKAPTPVMEISELSSSPDNLFLLPGIEPTPPPPPPLPQSSEPVNFNSIDEQRDPACDDPSIEPLKLLQLQRNGICPVPKTPTRYGW